MKCDGDLRAVKTKAVILPTIFIFIIVPFMSFAQQLETIISADQISIQPDNILKAKGNVFVKRGAVSIRAEAMTVNEEIGQIEFQGIKEFFDGDSLKLSGEDAILSDDLSSGIINAAQVLIDDTIKIRAEKIMLKNSNVERAETIDRVTSCDDCVNGSPLWYFTASSATNDLQNKNIIYRDVTLRVRGVPIGYMPYLRLPNPNVDRARGFLTPVLTITSNLGVGVKLPYFIPIGESRDLLLTPYISPKTKGVEYRYRHKFSDGDITINGAYSSDDIFSKGLRSYYRAIGSFELAYGFGLKVKAGRASDNTYLEDYSYGSEDDLTTDITLGKVVINNDRLFSGDLNYFRDYKDDNSLEEFYALSGVYKKRIDQTLLPGNLFFEVEGNSALNVADGGQVRRPPSFAASEVRYAGFRNAGPIKILDQSSVRLTSFVNSENTESLQEEFTLQYGISSTFSVPFYQTKNTLARQLSPKFMLSYNGQEGRTSGNYFSGVDHLSVGNIYNGKKIASSSESELGFSVSGGLDYRVNWDDGRALYFWFGGVWLEGTTTSQNQNTLIQPKTLNYVGGFNYRSHNALLVNIDTVLDKEGEILTANLSNKIEIKDFNLATRYEFIDAQNDERINEDLENINLSASYTGFENFSVSAIRRYDLSERAVASSTSSFGMEYTSGFWDYQFSQTFDRKEPEKTVMSAIYNDDCTRVSFSLQNSSKIGSFEDSIQSLLVMVQLKPFASFSVPRF